MQHTIIMVTFPQTIKSSAISGTNARRAFFGNNAISFNDATISSVTIEDDDDQFGVVRSAAGYTPETQQRLVSATTFGHDVTPTPAGTQLEPYPGSIITDSNNNQFYVFFTATPEAVELGGRFSALIVPIAKIGENDQLEWPEFDPSLSFRQTGTVSFGTGTPGIPYPPANSPPCFTPGTRIATPIGPRLVEDLRAGDMVLTRDNGVQIIRWIGRVRLSATRLDLQPNLRPIRITAGALGPAHPTADLIVSPQHRILVTSRIAERMFGCNEVLVAAKHLVGLSGIEVLRPNDGLTYLHMLFDQHELVLSNGFWTESLLPRDRAINGLSSAAQHEIRTLFPDLSGPAPARKILTGREGRALAGRHAKNQRVLVIP